MNTIRRALAQCADYRLEELGEESLIFNRLNKRTIYLNPSATVIWKLCDGERTVDDIIEMLREAYADVAADFTADVQRAVEAMLDEGALRWVAPGGTKAAGG